MKYAFLFYFHDFVDFVFPSFISDADEIAQDRMTGLADLGIKFVSNENMEIESIISDSWADTNTNLVNYIGSMLVMMDRYDIRNFEDYEAAQKGMHTNKIILKN